jgi:hypothetical protein
MVVPAVIITTIIVVAATAPVPSVIVVPAVPTVVRARVIWPLV